MQVSSPRARSIAVALTLMASGRAMTLAFVARAGDGGPGDPPEPWLMPLIGDAAIGVTALAVAYVLWKRPRPSSWLIAVVWSSLAAFDALAAYLVDLASPWPEFFMLEVFGRAMFFGAALMHLVIIGLLLRPDVMAYYRVQPGRLEPAR